MSLKEISTSPDIVYGEGYMYNSQLTEQKGEILTYEELGKDLLHVDVASLNAKELDRLKNRLQEKMRVLHNKLGDDPRQPQFIQNNFGKGYIFNS